MNLPRRGSRTGTVRATCRHPNGSHVSHQQHYNGATASCGEVLMRTPEQVAPCCLRSITCPGRQPRGPWQATCQRQRSNSSASLRPGKRIHHDDHQFPAGCQDSRPPLRVGQTWAAAGDRTARWTKKQQEKIVNPSFVAKRQFDMV